MAKNSNNIYELEWERAGRKVKADRLAKEQERHAKVVAAAAAEARAKMRRK